MRLVRICQIPKTNAYQATWQSPLSNGFCQIPLTPPYGCFQSVFHSTFWRNTSIRGSGFYNDIITTLSDIPRIFGTCPCPLDFLSAFLALYTFWNAELSEQDWFHILSWIYRSGNKLYFLCLTFLTSPSWLASWPCILLTASRLLESFSSWILNFFSWIYFWSSRIRFVASRLASELLKFQKCTDSDFGWIYLVWFLKNRCQDF